MGSRPQRGRRHCRSGLRRGFGGKHARLTGRGNVEPGDLSPRAIGGGRGGRFDEHSQKGLPRTGLVPARCPDQPKLNKRVGRVGIEQKRLGNVALGSFDIALRPPGTGAQDHGIDGRWTGGEGGTEISLRRGPAPGQRRGARPVDQGLAIIGHHGERGVEGLNGLQGAACEQPGIAGLREDLRADRLVASARHPRDRLKLGRAVLEPLDANE